MSRILVIIIALFVLFFQTAEAEKVEELIPKKIVQKEVEFLSDKEYVNYSQLWTRAMQQEILFVHSPSRRKDTIFNVEQASLIGMRELPLGQASWYVPKLSKYISRFGESGVQVLYVAVSYKVKEETKYQLRGINYFVQVFVKEHGKWKIAESVIAPTTTIIADGYGFGTDDEKEFSKRRAAIKTSS